MGDTSGYEVRLDKDFVKELKNLIKAGNKQLKDRVKEVISELEKNPHMKRPQLDVKLTSTRKLSIYRVRIGKFRILYQIDEENSIVYVTTIFRRERGY